MSALEKRQECKGNDAPPQINSLSQPFPLAQTISDAQTADVLKNSLPTFYEFFAGGGMARAGLGDEWRCTFANEIDPKKAASYAANWDSAELQVCDVAKLTLRANFRTRQT